LTTLAFLLHGLTRCALLRFHASNLVAEHSHICFRLLKEGLKLAVFAVALLLLLLLCAACEKLIVGLHIIATDGLLALALEAV